MRVIVLVSAIAALLSAALSPAPARAGKVAFVVGIDSYDHLAADRQLQRAVQDARAVSASLKSLGFDVVSGENLRRLDLNRLWQRYLNQLRPGDTAALFFAGHGVEIGGINYLLPRDVPSVTAGEEEVLKSEAVSLTSLIDALRARQPGVGVLIVDACRDNPFEKRGGRSLGGGRGLGRIEAPEGLFVIFSAGAGETALDRLPSDTNPNSVFTRSLLPLLSRPGLTLPEVAQEVRRSVRELTLPVGHRQSPAYYDEVVGKFCLAGCTVVATAAPAANPTPATPEVVTPAPSPAPVKPAPAAQVDAVVKPSAAKPTPAPTPVPVKPAQTQVAAAAPTPAPAAPAKPSASSSPAEPDKPHLCDHLAALAGSGVRGVFGTRADHEIVAHALLPCEQAMKAYPTVARYELQLGIAQYQSGFVKRGLETIQRAGRRGAPEAGFVLMSLDRTFRGDDEAVKARLIELDKAGSRMAAFSLAMLELDKNSEEAGFKAMKAAAERGNPLARLGLGMMLDAGVGTQRDQVLGRQMIDEVLDAALANGDVSVVLPLFEGPSKDAAGQAHAEIAVRFLERAYTAGMLDVAAALSEFKQGDDGARTIETVLKPAADKGNVPAALWLAEKHAKGHGLPKSTEDAVRYYKIAAGLGDARANFEAGKLILEDDALKAREAEGAALIKTAAQQGVTAAMSELAFFHKLGKYGVGESPSEALKWYRRAAEAGDPTAMRWLGKELADGAGGSPDKSAGYFWFRKAADEGGLFEAISFADDLASGTTIDKNIPEAIGWYRQAVAQQDYSAMLKLAKVLAEDGPTANPKEAFELLRTVAEKSYFGSDAGDALGLIARAQLDGKGTTADPVAAAKSAYDAVAKKDYATESWLTSSAATLPVPFVKALQQNLKDAGHYTGAIDGKAGKGFIAAIEKLKAGS